MSRFGALPFKLPTVQFCISLKNYRLYTAIGQTVRCLKGLLFILIVSAILVGCNNTSQNKPPETPSPTSPCYPTVVPTSPGPLAEEDIFKDSAFMAVQRDVVSTVEVEVEGKDKTITIQPNNGSDGICYSDYNIKVVRYLVDPLPYEQITLRIIEYYIKPDGATPPCRWCYSLNAGEDAIIFISKETPGFFPLQDNEFTVAGGPYGILSIEDGQVSISREYIGVKEPSNEFIARLQQYARQAGRCTP